MNTGPSRCARCVLSASFPRIEFDSAGVCSFCRDRAFFATDGIAIAQAKIQVESLLSGLAKGRRYDAVACLSGGKDSSYTLMLAVRNYGLKTLAFTFDNGFLSTHAFENIRRVVGALAVDHIMTRPSRAVMTSIIRASAINQVWPPRSLTRISAVCNSCITMVNTGAEAIALEKGIPLVIAGFTLGQIPSNAVVYRPNYRFIQESRSKEVDALERHAGVPVGPFFTIEEDLLQRPSPWHVNLLCLEMASEQDIVAAVEKLGWRQPDDVDGCSSNCRLNAFNNFVHELAYGYNPYELELSHLIRHGLLTRDQALAKLQDKANAQVEGILGEIGLARSDLFAATAVLGRSAAGKGEENLHG